MPTSYRQAVLISIGLHAVLIIGSLIHFPHTAKAYTEVPTPAASIKVHSVSQTEVSAVIHRIKAEAAAKKRAEIVRVNRLKRQAWLAKKARLAEERRLAAIKEAKHRMLIKQRAEAARQKALQKKQLEAAKRLAAIKAAKEAAKKKEAAMQKAEANLQKKALAQAIAADQKRLDAIEAKRMASEIATFKARILAAIAQRWVLPSSADPSLSSVYLISLAPDGAVLDIHLEKTSGNSALDRSARLAIYKASPLPVPKNPVMFDNFRQLRLTVSPKSVLSTTGQI